MFIRFFFILVLSISFAEARNISLSYGLFGYHYSSAPELLQIKGKQLDLKLAKNECNKDLTKNFESKISKAIDSMVKQKNPLPEGMKLTLDDVVTYQSKSTPPGKFFLGLPGEFKKLVAADRFKCGKKSP